VNVRMKVKGHVAAEVRRLILSPRLSPAEDIRASSRRLLQGFTMIEIAIALAVIAFALIAIIGILPTGLNVQQSNREDTIVSQDGMYFMDVLRFGRQGRTQDQGKALDFLTNYVDAITIIKTSPNKPITATFSLADKNMTNGQIIMDLLSTPRYEPDPTHTFIYTNTVVATNRGMSGSALEQNGANTITAFKYAMEVQLVPASTSPPMIGDGFNQANFWLGIPDEDFRGNNPTSQARRQFLQNQLFELRIACSWPVLPTGTVGPNRRYFRTTVSGTLHQAWRDGSGTLTGVDPNCILYYIDPQSYPNRTPSQQLEPVGTNTLFQ
jgi:hypothetical protein